MKKYFILALGCLFMSPLTAQDQVLDYKASLPVDKSITKGVLPNGLTYYIKSTDVVQGAASYYIIQNVGSVLENDDQQGLAHFLEHMAFNGTEHFPGKGILNTLQEHGAVFGKDFNAYTSFDETVYNLSNIPTKDGLVDVCLTVLHDWSNYLLLTDEEIDAERGVIKEEWRTRQSGRMRLYQTSLPITYNHSKYADRLPIGSMKVVENFKYKALRDFYHDWYRTDLQAIAIIGDVDVAEIEKQIIQKFSGIPSVKNPRERFVVDIPDNKGMLYSLGTDPEISTASISFGVRHKKSLEDETIADVKQSLLESMATGMLSARISERSRKPEATFLGARVGYGSMARTANTFSVGIVPKPQQQQQAFKEVFTEVERAVRYGYTQSEIERRITNIKNGYANSIAKQEDRSHSQIVGGIQNNYLSNSPMADLEQKYEIVKQLLASISPEELHGTIKRLYAADNRYLNVTGVEGENNLTQQQALDILAAIAQDPDIEPYTETIGGKTLISGLDIRPGSIVSIDKDNPIGATTYQLSNGVTVHYKFVDKQKDRVSLRAHSYGGTSLLDEADLPSAAMLGNLVQMSGLGEFSATDLKKVLAGKTAGARTNLGDISEGISGSSNTKDVETMLQLVHVSFVKPRFDPEAYTVLESNLQNFLIQKSKDVGSKMKDSLVVAIYGDNNPYKPIFDADYVADISFDRMKRIYGERFAHVSDFEFFILGDVQEEQLKPLLEQYLASIPTQEVSEAYKDTEVDWLSDRIDRDIYLPMEDPKANVNINFKKAMAYDPAKALYAKALGDILQLRVTESVRESEGGAYSPRASAYVTREPEANLYVGFGFDCNPEMADKLVTIVTGELQKIAEGEIKTEDLEKTRTNFLKEREQAKDKNGFDMQEMTMYFRYGEQLDSPEHFSDVVTKMSKSDIQELAQSVLEDNKSYEIIFKPQE